MALPVPVIAAPPPVSRASSRIPPGAPAVSDLLGRRRRVVSFAAAGAINKPHASICCCVGSSSARRISFGSLPLSLLVRKGVAERDGNGAADDVAKRDGEEILHEEGAPRDSRALQMRRSAECMRARRGQMGQSSAEM